MDSSQRPTHGAKVYEMLWDCKFCGTRKLLGKTHRFCPNCGAQQDATARYFPSDTEKVAVEDHVYVGADRICPACKSLSSAKAEFCGNCGKPLSGAAEAQQGASRTGSEDEQFGQSDKVYQKPKPSAAAAAPQKKSSGAKPLLILAVVVAVIGGGIFALTRSQTSSAYVTGFRWERSLNVERFEAVPGKGDCNAVPIGAYSVNQQYEQVGSRQVPDGERCERVQVDQGDGTFREEQRCTTTYRSEPVYGYVCYYLLNTWVFARTEKLEGTKEQEPTWPSLSSTGNCFTLGCEREGGRNERYYLKLRYGDRDFECPVEYGLWEETGLERSFTVEVGSVLRDVRCGTLKPSE